MKYLCALGAAAQIILRTFLASSISHLKGLKSPLGVFGETGDAVEIYDISKKVDVVWLPPLRMTPSAL
jgi:hypothetical protein